MGKKKGCKGCMGCGCIGSVVVCLVGFATFQAIFGGPASSLDNELKLARAQGLATEAKDMEVGIDPSKSLARAYDALTRDPQFRKVNFGLDGSKSTDAERAKVVAELGPQIAAAEKLAASPRANLVKDWKNSPAMILFPEFATMKGCARLLTIKARVKSKQGDGVGAMATLEKAAIFGRHAGESPTIIGMLVRVACESIVLHGVELVLRDHPSDPGVVAGGRRVIHAIGPVPDVRYAMRGEMLFGLSITNPDFTLKDTGAVTSDTDPASVSFAIAMKTATVRNAFAANLVKFHRELNEALPKDPEDWRGIGTAMKDADRKLQADPNVTAFLTKMISPVFSELGSTLGNLIVRRKLMTEVISLVEQHQKGMPYPKSLSATGSEAIDPWSNDVFRYRLNSNGFDIWSVGRNGIDDGGVGDKALDIVYSIK